jgi:hypothetical protein
MKSIAGWLVTIAVLGIFSSRAEAEPAPARLRLAPDAVYIKTGLAEKSAALSLGVGWDKSDWLWSSLPDALSLTFDLEIGHWQTVHPRRDQAKFTQFGVTPLLRYPLATSLHRVWFVEGGVGFHFIVPLYRTNEKRFSSSFNFQDLLGFGLRFGQELRHEVVLYGSHFSNADINKPNPGEDFLQLRYLRHFD